MVDAEVETLLQVPRHSQFLLQRSKAWGALLLSYSPIVGSQQGKKDTGAGDPGQANSAHLLGTACLPSQITVPHRQDSIPLASPKMRAQG